VNYAFFIIYDNGVWKMQTLGKRLADIRKSKKYKQTDLAKMLNVSQQVISNIERDVTVPDIEQLKKFADIYNVSLDQLVGREFFDEDSGDMDRKILSCIKQMDDEGKELSLGLLNQVAQHRGSNDGNK
jgi:transcriptional regulator with XRE-family HTH domain